MTKYLLAAPKIARDTAPFFWTYLDCPQDGTIFLTWQPAQRRGLEFSSDGYVWAGSEVYYRQEAGNGLVGATVRRCDGRRATGAEATQQPCQGAHKVAR